MGCADESPAHINVLELHAAQLTLLALAAHVSLSHIRLMLDNSTTASYIDKMGGLHSPACNDRAISIWGWDKDRDNWLSTAFITVIENTVANFHSRNFQVNTEWMLNPVMFERLIETYLAPRSTCLRAD